MARDNQRQKVYDAEHSTFDRSGVSDPAFTLREAQKYVNRVSSKGVYQALRGPKGVVLKRNPRRRSFSAVVGPYSIELADGWGYNKDVILHELSHLVVYHTLSEYQDHGAEFVLIYRRLIEQEFGRDTRVRFDIEAEKRGVRWGTNGNLRLQKKLSL